MEITARCCSLEAEWNDAPTCKLQESINPCPQGFDNTGSLCYVIIENTTYPPRCPYPGILPFQEYVSEIDSSLFPIWMPVERDKSYGLGSFYWMEPTISYRFLFDSCSNANCTFQINSLEHSCSIYHNSTFMETAPCTDSYKAICAYSYLHRQRKSLCSQKWPSKVAFGANTPLSPDVFVSSMERTEEKATAEFLLEYQNLLYQYITDKECSIGLEKRNMTYTWTSSKLTLNYTNWSPSTTFGENYTYGVFTTEGWMLRTLDTLPNCSVLQTKVFVEDSNLALSFDKGTNVFTLEITRPENLLQDDNTSVPLVFCFTTAAIDKIVDKVSISLSTQDQSSVKFNFEPLSPSSGDYWCEAFLYQDLEPKKSNRYFLRDTKEEYMLEVTTSFANGTDPLTEVNYKYLQEQLATEIKPLDSTFVPRIFKIVAVNEETSLLVINFHLSNSIESTTLSNYGILQNFTMNRLRKFSFRNFLSVDVCIGYHFQTVTWPTTNVGNLAKRPIEGWCVGNNGSILHKWCGGNFVDGAIWNDLNEPCVILGSTNTTVNLTNIINIDNAAEYVDEVAELTSDYENLVSAEVALISQFLNQLANTKNINSAVLSIINSLMKVAEDVLKEAQQEYAATDSIITSIPAIVKQLDITFDVVMENFKILSISKLQNVSALSVLLTENNQQYSLTPRYDTNDIETVAVEGYFVSAIIFPKKFLDEILEKTNNDTRLIILVYTSPNLFNENSSYRTTLSPIIQIIVPGIEDDVFTESFSVIFENQDASEQNNCSYWMYELYKLPGYWKSIDEGIEQGSKLKCDFYYHQRNLALSGDPNVTYELSKIINGDLPMEQKLRRTADIVLRFYSKFHPIDVVYVNTLLNMLKGMKGDEDFNSVLDITNGIMDISRIILEKAQFQYNVTGLIFENFLRLIMDFPGPKDVTKSNLYILIRHLDQDMFGLRIHSSINSSTVTILNHPQDCDDQDELCVNFSDELRKLFNKNPPTPNARVMINIFFKDSLFVLDKGESVSASKIVGVYFLGLNDEIEGQVYILYTEYLALNYSCAVWQNRNGLTPNWENATSPILESSKYQCSFLPPGYFALIYGDINVTSALEMLLESSYNTEVIVHTTSKISEYYEAFKPYDVSLVAKLLSITNETKFLEQLVKIMNNLMNIDRNILEESQMAYSSLSNILVLFWKITGTIVNKMEISMDNLHLVAVDLRGTSLFTAKDVNNIMLGKKYITTTMNHIKAQLELSQKLVDSILNASEDFVPILVITVFYNDRLFIDRLQNANITNIFGVQIPNYNIALPNKFKLSFDSSNQNIDNTSCAVWDFGDYERKGIWIYHGKIRSRTLSCSFYQQGYFTLLELTMNNIPNVTQELEIIKNSQISFSEKLYRSESLSYHYPHYQPEDLLILSNVLQQSQDVDEVDLSSVANMLNNILLIPRIILHKSQIKYNTLNSILNSTNAIAAFAQKPYAFDYRDEFWLLVCQLNTSIGAVIAKSSLNCTSIFEPSLQASSVTALFSADMHNYILMENPAAKFIVSIFHNNAFFAASEDDTALVLGFSVPDFDHLADGGLNVFYNDLGGSATNSCGYWDYITNTKIVGQWWYTDTNYNDSQIQCEYREPKYYSLVKNEDQDTSQVGNLTEILFSILNSAGSSSEKLEDTKHTVSEYNESFKSLHLHLVVQILSSIMQVNQEDLECLFQIIDDFIEFSRELLVQSQQQYDATDLLLFNLDRLAGNYQGTLLKQMNNFAIYIAENVTAVVVDGCEKNCTLHHITEEITLREFKDNDEMNSGIYLDKNLRAKLSEKSLKIIFTVFFNDKLFNEGTSDSNQITGNVVGIVIPQLTDDLNGSFWFYDDSNYNNICAFWNYSISEEAAKIQRGYWERDGPASGSLCESRQYPAHFALLEDDNITNTLVNILDGNAKIEKKLKNVVQIVSEMPGKLSPVDVYLIAQIIGDVLLCNMSTIHQMNLTSQIVSHLFNVERSVLREAQNSFRATDRILHHVDNIASRLKHNISEANIIHDNFIVAVFQLKSTNISGLQLEHCSSTTCSISSLSRNANLSKIVANKNLTTAVVLSHELINQIEESNDDPRLVVTIFFQDVFFNEESVRDLTTSLILGVLLPGLNDTLNGSIFILHNINDTTEYENTSCAFWKYKVIGDDVPIPGSWQADADPSNKDRTMICEYDHVTHFALLLASSSSSFEEATKNHILDIMSNVNCILSLAGIIGIMLTAALFERWRKNTGNLILVNFSLAISIKIVMLYVSGLVAAVVEQKLVCYVTGAILHYAVLSEFCWMLIIAILQFKRFVEVLGGRPKYVLLKACICGWIFPIFPVVLISIIDVDNYYQGTLGLCYPSGLGLYLGVWLPLIIIISINFVIFLFIIYNVFHKKTEFKEQINYEILFQWRLALLLFSMLGLTWLFGFISLFEGATVFIYLFCFTASLQGFVMFLFFIVFNKSTRFLYVQGMKSWLYSNGYKYH